MTDTASPARGVGEIRDIIVPLNFAGALTVGVKTTPGSIFVVPFNLAVLAAYLNVGTAPTGAALIVNIQRTPISGAGAAQLWTTAGNRPTVAISATTNVATSGSAGSLVGAAPAGPDTSQCVRGDVLAINVIQVGSTVAGSDLSVTLHCERY